MVSYYDYILASIPTLLIGGAIVGKLSGTGIQTTVALSALVSIVFMGHALFVRAPVATEKVGKAKKTITNTASNTAKPVTQATKKAGKKVVSDTKKVAVSTKEPVKNATSSTSKQTPAKSTQPNSTSD